MSHALLLIGCSARKAAIPAGRAWDLYDGRLFQVLKRAFREAGRPAGLTILIVSARYGIIRDTRRIATYDCRLALPAAATRPAWEAQLGRLTRGQTYDQVHVSLGSRYRAALPDLTRFFSGADISFAEGGIGRRNAATRAWVLALLRGPVSDGMIRRSSHSHRGLV